MTIREIVSAIKKRTRAQEAAEVVSREVLTIRREFIGKADVETMPNGNLVSCLIVEIDWVQAYETDGGWAVRVIYSSGALKGQFSWTSDKVLEIMGSR